MDVSLFKKFGRVLFTFLRLVLVLSGAEGWTVISWSTGETDDKDAELAFGHGVVGCFILD